MFATSFLFLDCGFIIPQDKAFFCDEVTLIKKVGATENRCTHFFYFSAGRKKLFDPLKFMNINRCASVAGAYACCSFSSAAPAAACSASFLLWPVPVENTSPFSSTAASKTLAWSGPVEPTSR